jgi:hypothetical protein
MNGRRRRRLQHSGEFPFPPPSLNSQPCHHDCSHHQIHESAVVAGEQINEITQNNNLLMKNLKCNLN